MADEEKPFVYVSFDRARDAVLLRLPPNQEQYRQELQEELAEEFSFEPHSAGTESRMNEYVTAWIARRQGGTSAAAGTE